jgi:hypothetical protein
MLSSFKTIFVYMRFTRPIGHTLSPQYRKKIYMKTKTTVIIGKFVIAITFHRKYYEIYVSLLKKELYNKLYLVDLRAQKYDQSSPSWR